MAKLWGIRVTDKANPRWVTGDSIFNENTGEWEATPVTFSLRREAQAEAESMNKLTKQDLWKVEEYK